MASSSPELLYVNSKISQPASLSAELFSSWYNDTHIPDIFATSGIKQAYRYLSTADDPSTIERPYLALYPVKSKGYLLSAEFRAIPLKSDLFPGPTHEIFDVADFDTRYCTLTSSNKPFEGSYLLTVQFDSEKAATDIKSMLSGGMGTVPLDSGALFSCYLSMQNRKLCKENEPGTPPARLALLWYESQEKLDDAANSFSRIGQTAQFKLMKAFQAQDADSGSKSPRV